MQDAQSADAEAVRATLAGHADAFGTLVARYQEVAFRAAYLILRDASAAEDVAQEGFIRSYRNLARFRVDDPFRPWLLRIVTNLALNEARARGRRRGLADRVLRRAPPERPVGEDPAAQVVRDERDAAVLLALRELRADDRTVLYLRHFLELTESELATALGVRPGTVKSRLNRASARLRAVIELRYPALAPGAAEAAEMVGGADDDQR
jgi:RNA polymerase sigma-70 factor, ECF subfamily